MSTVETPALIDSFIDTPRQVEMIPVKDVVVKETAIRKVESKNADYIALVEDLRKNELHDPITVRSTYDKDIGTHFYELVDGGHRLSAFKELGREDIPAFVFPPETTKIQMLGIQFRKNKLRIQQTATQEAKQYERMMAEGNLTAEDLSLITGYTVAEINKKLQLGEDKLEANVIKMVENGAISVNNARVLSKAGKSMQNPEIIEAAVVLNATELKQRIDTTKKALADGEDTAPKVKEEKEFEPRFNFRSKDVIKKEIDTGALGGVKFSDPALQDAFREGVLWCVSLDEQTVTEEREAFELAKSEKERVKIEKDLAKQRKKIEDMERKAREDYGITDVDSE